MNQSPPSPQPQESRGDRQLELLAALHRHKAGLSVEALAGEMSISRNGVRQHLAALERDGLVARGASVPSGGRPEQLYVLTARAEERFPRQYSWFAELLLEEIGAQAPAYRLAGKLGQLGRKVGQSMRQTLAGKDLSPERIRSLADAMTGLGYDATARTGPDGPAIEAYNCVYHALAAQNADVCAFDLGLLEACSGGKVEHQSCMVRGGASCRFRFLAVKPENKSGKMR